MEIVHPPASLDTFSPALFTLPQTRLNYANRLSIQFVRYHIIIICTEVNESLRLRGKNSIVIEDTTDEKWNIRLRVHSLFTRACCIEFIKLSITDSFVIVRLESLLIALKIHLLSSQLQII